MSQSLILIPVFAQVMLTLGVIAGLWWARITWMHATKTNPQKMALAEKSAWDERSQKFSNNLTNLFELPVLFYAASAFAYSSRMIDDVMLGLAVLFVVARIAHTVFHVGPNWVVARFWAVLASAVIVCAMWILLMWRVASAGF